MARPDSHVLAGKRTSYRHAFVDILPEKLEEGVLYVSGQYATSAHNCFCGCGREVVTPIHPTKWQLTFDGIHVSLFPSIGSWSLPCQSHYWIEGGAVSWAESFSEADIRAVRAGDSAALDRYFEKKDNPMPVTVEATVPPSAWRRAIRWFRGQ